MFGPLFLRRFFRGSLLRGCQAPAAVLAVQALILLFPRDGRRPLHAKNLVHRLSGRDIVARKPALTVHRAGIFMFAPI